MDKLTFPWSRKTDPSLSVVLHMYKENKCHSKAAPLIMTYNTKRDIPCVSSLSGHVAS